MVFSNSSSRSFACQSKRIWTKTVTAGSETRALTSAVYFLITPAFSSA